MTSQCGVYRIVNTTNGKVYIGSSKNIEKRFRQHQYQLRKGTHHSPLLQRSWKVHGEGSFLFEILELCAEENLVSREQFWMDTSQCYLADKGYNCAHNAEHPRAVRWTDQHREEQRQLNLGKKMSPEAVAKTAAFHRGSKRTEATCRKISEALRKHYGSDLNGPPKKVSRKGGGGKGVPKSEAHRQKIGDAHRGVKESPESIEKNRQGHIGLVCSDELREKRRLIQTGKKHTDATKAKMSISQKGRVFSETTRKKMSESAKKKPPVSEESRKKMSESGKGRVFSESHRKHLSEANQRRNARKKEQESSSS